MPAGRRPDFGKILRETDIELNTSFLCLQRE